jgi:cytochrome c oxidase subunit 3
LPEAHAGALAHHFETADQQRESATLGMWLFIAQEVMFFGGLFTCYLVYRLLYPAAFRIGSRQLDIVLGGVNTGVLIASSFTMALGVWGAQKGRKKVLVGGLIATLLLGGVFLGIKTVEYKAKFDHHLVPGPHFHFAGPQPEHVELFMSLYFGMTGMHALHMVVGAAILLVLIPMAIKDRFGPHYFNPIENFGLYWHFVDIIWIFLFPLLYLLGHH